MASPISPIRKKRNFKALQLAVAKPAQPPPPPEPEPIAIRQAPTAAGAPAGKRRPPPMTLKAPKIPNHGGAVSAVEQEAPNMLTVVSNGPNSAPNTASPSARRNTYHATLSNTLANLDMNTEIKFDLRNEDLKDMSELGQGNGGSVKKVEHTPTGTIMAKKVRLKLRTRQLKFSLRSDDAVDCAH
jgi:mitogen-activated protein kinase kinase